MCLGATTRSALSTRVKESPSLYTFALVDTTGNPLCSTKGDMSLQQDDGTEKLVPWTLQTYLSVKNIRFPSKLKLYCLLQTRSVGTAATRPGMVYTHTKLGVIKAIRMISVHVLALALQLFWRCVFIRMPDKRARFFNGNGIRPKSTSAECQFLETSWRGEWRITTSTQIAKSSSW